MDSAYCAIEDVLREDWGRDHSIHRMQALREALEQGRVLRFVDPTFKVREQERACLNPAWTAPGHKNISLDGGVLRGWRTDAPHHAQAHQLVARYRRYACAIVNRLLPSYVSALCRPRTSLRLHRVETRQGSWRQDDSRLHIDAFPSRPNHGERILRVFTNINPDGDDRVWRLGEPFEHMAKRFLPRVRPALPGSAWLAHALGLTKRLRSDYDHLMLCLHDLMKADLDYQRDAPQQLARFAAGTVWICFSDQTVHAAMAGQYMLEQTFSLPVESTSYPEWSPLRVLERLQGKALT